MWADDPYWMPLFLKNKKFKGRFVFDEPVEVVLTNCHENEAALIGE